MRKNVALRQCIIDCAISNSGIADTAQMRAAVKTARIKKGLRYLDKCAQTLAKEGVLRRLGKGIYVHAGSFDAKTLGIFARMPYGTHLYGRILHVMLTQRFLTTGQVITKLRSRGCEYERQDVYAAINQLKDGGYVDLAGAKTYTLGRKTLDALGLKDVLAPPGEYAGTLRERLTPHVRDLLLSEPPKHVHDIHAHLQGLGFDIELPEVHRVIHRLWRHEPVRRTAVATYTLLPAAPAAAAAEE